MTPATPVRPRYFVRETLNNLWQFKTRHFFSLTIICLSSLILGVFLSLSNNLNAKAGELSRDVNVVFDLSRDASPADRDRLAAELRASPLVGAVRSVSAEEALARFLKDFPELSDIVSNLKGNPFPPSVEADLRRPDVPADDVTRLIAEARRSPAVTDAQFNRDWAERVRSLSRLARNAGLFLGGILVLASLLIVSNVIKLNVLARKSEIELLRLVGATNAFIRVPFLLEGVAMGLLGGVLSLGLILLVVKLFPIYLGASMGALQELFGFRYLTWIQALGLVFGGGLVGFLGSLSSIARFLRV
jgi:cell division transport system permease protein